MAAGADGGAVTALLSTGATGGRTMTAAVIAAPGELALRSVPIPEPAAGEVLVRVEACGISGTCLRSYLGTFPGTVYPVTPGLEIGGVVEAVGPRVEGVEPGQRVAVEPVVECGACSACRAGRYNCCARLRLYGVHLPGGMAGYVTVRAERAHRVPDDLPPVLAALCEPFSIGAQAVHRARIGPGEAAIVLGGGVIGLTVLLLARARGARALVVEPHAGRAGLARELGAEAVFVGGADVAGEMARTFTDGQGADVVIEATGVPAAIAAAGGLAAHGGRLGLVGVPSEPAGLPVLECVRKELDVYGVRNCCGHYGEAIEFVARHRELAQRLISRVFPFGETVAAFRFAERDGVNCLRVVLDLAEA